MKMSEITVADVAEYLRLDEYTESFIQTLLDTAKSFVLDYTSLTAEEADTKDNLWIAIMVLCQDMNDNRSMYVDKNNVNKVVDAVLGMHIGKNGGIG